MDEIWTSVAGVTAQSRPPSEEVPRREIMGRLTGERVLKSSHIILTTASWFVVRQPNPLAGHASSFEAIKLWGCYVGELLNEESPQNAENSKCDLACRRFLDI